MNFNDQSFEYVNDNFVFYNVRVNYGNFFDLIEKDKYTCQILVKKDSDAGKKLLKTYLAVLSSRLVSPEKARETLKITLSGIKDGAFINENKYGDYYMITASNYDKPIIRTLTGDYIKKQEEVGLDKNCAGIYNLCLKIKKSNPKSKPENLFFDIIGGVFIRSLTDEERTEFSFSEKNKLINSIFFGDPPLTDAQTEEVEEVKHQLRSSLPEVNIEDLEL